MVVDGDDANHASDLEDSPNHRRRAENDDASTLADVSSGLAEGVDAAGVHKGELGEIEPDGPTASGEKCEGTCQGRCASKVDFTREAEHRR
jgi:hypothetical protein